MQERETCKYCLPKVEDFLYFIYSVIILKVYLSNYMIQYELSQSRDRQFPFPDYTLYQNLVSESFGASVLAG